MIIIVIWSLFHKWLQTQFGLQNKFIPSPTCMCIYIYDCAVHKRYYSKIYFTFFCFKVHSHIITTCKRPYFSCYMNQDFVQYCFYVEKSFKVALGVCFALKSWKEYLFLFTYLITLGKDVTLPLITKFKTNRPLSNLFVNRITN